MVGAGLGRGVWAVGRIRRGLGERRIRFSQGAVDLVGRHVQEAESRFCVALETLPGRARRFEQYERADDVGLDERRRPVDRAIDMAFGGEVHHRARAMLGEELLEQRGIADVAVDENVSRFPGHGLEARKVAGIGELVEVHHGFAAGADPVEDEVRADEARAAGHEDGHARAPAARPR